MAQINADFSVAEGRLGINNPDPYGTLFSLRQELFRILDDPATTADDDMPGSRPWSSTSSQPARRSRRGRALPEHLRKPDGTPVPGIIIPSAPPSARDNFFGLHRRR
jgi:hypothetical protein